MKFGPLGVFDLTSFLAMGYDFFPGGCEKKGVAGGASVEGAGVGWDCRRASKWLFFRSRMQLGAVGFRAAGGPTRAEYFPFRFGSGRKKSGLPCSMFVHFWPVLGLLGTSACYVYLFI